MIGYGEEDDNYVLELTYNYGIKTYRHGNEFPGITLVSPEAISRIGKYNYPSMLVDGYQVITSPCGYTFRIKCDEGIVIF